MELTSGNTGTGLAIVCGVKGYPFVAVISKGNSSERVRMMSALGAEVVQVEQRPDSGTGQVSGGGRRLGEHSGDAAAEGTPEPVRHDIEELNHQITVLQEQQEIVGQHLDALQQL